MATQDAALILFKFVALIFALSFQQCSRAWMASQLGDQTARMLGRLSFNPIKQLDPIGSVLLPLIMMFSFPGSAMVGWPKPMPVTPRNFRNYKRDDILVALTGPLSNLALAVVSLLLLLVIKYSFAAGRLAAVNAALLYLRIEGVTFVGQSAIFPIALLLYSSIAVNLLLAIFNLLPVPPLDGAHILRYYLPYNWQQQYDRLTGIAGLVILYLLLRLGVLAVFYGPLLGLANRLLLPEFMGH